MLFRPNRQFTLQNFLPRRGNAHARAAVIQLACCDRPRAPGVLIVAGPPSSGKSHLAHAATRLAWQTHDYAPCNVLSAHLLADQVVRGESFGDLPRLAWQLQTDPWLAIDDVELLAAWSSAADFLLSVLQERQKKHHPSLLTATLGVSAGVTGKLGSWLDQQPAVLLLRD